MKFAVFSVFILFVAACSALGSSQDDDVSNLPFISVQPSIDYSDPAVVSAIEEFYRKQDALGAAEAQADSSPLLARSGKVCGRRIQPRIIGGSQAGDNEFPWQVALKTVVQINETHQGAGLCGGSLISDTWVLTAAHCTDMSSAGYATNSITIMVGAHDISKSAEADARIDVQAKRWLEHPGWNPSNLENDLALIEIPSIANALGSKQFSPVCLPFGLNIADEGVNCVASGWGRVADDGGTSPVLKYINTKTMTYSSCKFKSLLTTLFLKKTMLCIETSSGTNNVCKGDSGGPLVKLEGDGLYYHIGLTSFGSSAGCQSSSDPSVFTRTKDYLSHICSTTGVCS